MGLNPREHGQAIFVDPGSDKPILEVGTLHCCHCGGQWIPKPGSGRMRGWCMNCNGPVCGPGCHECVPWEQYLENLEKNREPNFRPILISVPKIE